MGCSFTVMRKACDKCLKTDSAGTLQGLSLIETVLGTLVLNRVHGYAKR